MAIRWYSLTPRDTGSRLRRLSAFLAWAELGAAVLMVSLEAAMASATRWMVLVLAIANILVLAAFSLRVIVGGLAREGGRPRLASIAATVAVVVFTLVSLRIAAGVALLHDGLLALRWARGSRPTAKVLVGVGHRPARVLVLSFLALIALGTLLLSLPAASAGKSTAAVDALFTAVSATCVTGLATLDTATHWSPFGQGVIFVLFQLGGLGIMVISAAMTLAVGGAIGLRTGVALQSAFDENNAEELKVLLKSLVLWTLGIESVGAIVLALRFSADMPVPDAIWSAAFHAVSAFCNAGFSLYSNSLESYVSSPIVNGVMIGLIVFGGLGFGVLVALARLARGSLYRLPMHVKLVLVTSALLMWVGAFFYFFFEYDRSLAHLSLPGKLLAALFQSVTTRTAGFNSVPLGELHPVTVVVMIVLMFIGAAPGSTGGGIKVTTLALVFLAARAYLLERNAVEAFGRTVPDSQVLRALALAGGAAVSFVLGFATLLALEPAGFMDLAFETVSALGTVGLTLGVTPELSSAGRLVVCVLMFAGRVGPLTAVAAASTQRRGRSGITLPEGKVLVG